MSPATLLERFPGLYMIRSRSTSSAESTSPHGKPRSAQARRMVSIAMAAKGIPGYTRQVVAAGDERGERCDEFQNPFAETRLVQAHSDAVRRELSPNSAKHRSRRESTNY